MAHGRHYPYHFHLMTLFLMTALILMVFSCDDHENKTFETKKFSIIDEAPLVEVTIGDELDYLQPSADEEPESTQFFTVQIGAFSSLENAFKAITDLKSRGYSDVFLFENPSGSVPLYKVGLGIFENKGDAAAFLETLSIPGYEGMWIALVMRSPRLDMGKEGETDTSSEIEGSWEMAYLTHREGGINVWFHRQYDDPLLLKSSDENTRRPELSPNGERVAFLHLEEGSEGGEISVIDAARPEKEFIIPSPIPLNHHLFITDAVICYVSISTGTLPKNKIIIYDVVGRKGQVLFSTEQYRISDLSLSPDGKYLAYHASLGAVAPDSDEEVHVGIIDLKTGEKSVIRAGYSTLLLGWNPDDTIMIAYHEKQGDRNQFDYILATADLLGENIMRVEEVRPIENVNPGISSPNGRRIAFTTWKKKKETRNRIPDKLWIYDTKKKSLKRLLSRDAGIYYPAWSPEGDSLLFSSREGERWRAFLVEDLSDSRIRAFPKIKDGAFDISWR